MQYISTKNYSFLLEFLADNFGLELLELVQSPALVNKIKPNSGIEIEYNLQNSDGGGLFDTDNSANSLNNSKYLLVDLKNIVLETVDFKILQDLENSLDSGMQVFLCDSENDLNADSKKFLKQNNIQILEIKTINETVKSRFAQSYFDSNTNVFESSVRLKILKKVNEYCKDYYEIINILDFIFLATQYGQSLGVLDLILNQTLEVTEAVMTFKLGINETKKWMIKDEGELQKNLSILATKSEKSSKKTIIKNIINTDKNIKTRSKVKPLTWYKLLLWKIKNS
jgi:hypothetical protein